MNYKETLFFIGKCLTINHEAHNKNLVEKELKGDAVDWDNVVKVSTAQYVFPALYCNLKKAKFLHYLPEDLVGYMEHITNLNRERNEEIIKQAREINELLLKNNIVPIFLKGTGNLLEGLYDDIAERMVGDIDFLVSDIAFRKSIEVLKDNGYFKVNKKKPDDTFMSRHYPKMIKEGRISSIEVHYKMVSNKLFYDFNYDFVINNVLLKDKTHQLSYEDQIIMTSINKQINDNSELYKNFGLRNSYDLFLLSKKANTLEAIVKLNNNNKLNNFLFSSFNVLGNPKSIIFKKTNDANSFFQKQLQGLISKRKIKIRTRNKFSFGLKVFYKSFYKKEYRKYVISRIKSSF